MGRDGTPGSAGLHLAAGVPLLQPDEQVFAAMLDGWRAQQLARNLALGHDRSGGRRWCGRSPRTPTRSRGSGVRRCSMSGWATCAAVTGPAPVDGPVYASSVSAFCRYVTDPAYGWAGQCQARFGTHPVQVVP